MTVDTAFLERTKTGFAKTFGYTPELIAYAPGRVNLIGEHTDYNDGFVLPCALPFGTAVALSARRDGEVNGVAIDIGNAIDRFNLSRSVPPAPAGSWANHLRGVVAAMAGAGHPLTGADIAISGNIPRGAGLSSSASLGIALARGLAALAGGSGPDNIEIAKAAQWSEHHYVGASCGIMDQLASACGRAGHALLIDCRSLSIEPVPIPPDVRILVVHSGVERNLAAGAYNERRAQCEAAARHYGVGALRDLTFEALELNLLGLDETSYRRARHVVLENARTLETASALAVGDIERAGTLMRESHASLRDDFEVTVPAVDALVEALADAIGSAGGVRMTGGGFGGCVVALVRATACDAVDEALQRFWRSRGRSATLRLWVTASDGATTERRALSG